MEIDQKDFIDFVKQISFWPCNNYEVKTETKFKSIFYTHKSDETTENSSGQAEFCHPDADFEYDISISVHEQRLLSVRAGVSLSRNASDYVCQITDLKLGTFAFERFVLGLWKQALIGLEGKRPGMAAFPLDFDNPQKISQDLIDRSRNELIERLATKAREDSSQKLIRSIQDTLIDSVTAGDPLFQLEWVAEIDGSYIKNNLEFYSYQDQTWVYLNTNQTEELARLSTIPKSFKKKKFGMDVCGGGDECVLDDIVGDVTNAEIVEGTYVYLEY